MKIETVTYRRLRNLGNYENETVELTATVDTSEAAADVYEDLKALAEGMLYSGDKPRRRPEDPF